MPWSGQMGYAKAVWKEFQVDGKEAGLTKGYGSLQFLKVFHPPVSSVLFACDDRLLSFIAK